MVSVTFTAMDMPGIFESPSSIRALKIDGSQDDSRTELLNTELLTTWTIVNRLEGLYASVQ